MSDRNNLQPYVCHIYSFTQTRCDLFSPIYFEFPLGKKKYHLFINKKLIIKTYNLKGNGNGLLSCLVEV
jgi:hypothetical protein